METIEFREVMEIIHREFQSLKGYMEERFATKQELANAKLDLVEKISRLEEKMGTMKFDIVKWTFLFWATQTSAIIGLLLSLYKK